MRVEVDFEFSSSIMKELSIMRPSWHKIYFGILQSVVKRCLCIKLQTAAIIVRGSQVIAMGYNGTFSKSLECMEYWHSYYKKRNILISFDEWCKTDEFKNLHREWSKQHEIHAEANALRWIPPADDCIMYTLYSPCISCTKDIIAHNIKTVYYKHKYKHGQDSIILLHKMGIPCVQVI